MNREPSTSKKAVFIFITVILGLLVIELGVRGIEAGAGYFFTHNNSPYVEYENVRKVFETRSINGIAYHIRTSYHPHIQSGLRFPVEKSLHTFRVFCLGGSAAMGWPHPLNESYPAFLEKKLKLLYPEKNIEVINVAASTYASYRVKVIFDEIINYHPDLLLVYSGNNEFLERILYPQQVLLEAPWKHIATIRTVLRALTQMGHKKQVIDIENYQPTFLIDVALGNTSPLKISEKQYKQAVKHYRYNMEAMIAAAQDKGIPIMLLTVPANVRDWSPHASVHVPALDSTHLKQWQQYYREGIKAFEAAKYDQAIKIWKYAATLDAEYAELHYYLGKAYLANKNIRKASMHLMQSLEADAYPFRALPTLNDVLKNLSNTYDVPLADIQHILAKNSKYGITGLDVLVDHVHPTVSSNQVIANEVLLTLEKSGLISKTDTTVLAALSLPVYENAEATLPLMQNLFLIYRVLLQFDKMDDLYERCRQLPAHEKQSPEYQQFMSEFDRFLEVVQPYKKLLFAHKTGQLHQQFTQAEIITIVQNYVELNKKSLTANMSAQEFEQFLPVFIK